MVTEKIKNLRRLEAQRNELNAKGKSLFDRGIHSCVMSVARGGDDSGSEDINANYQGVAVSARLKKNTHMVRHTFFRLLLAVRMLREELQLLQEPGSYVGEVVKAMGKTKILVKVCVCVCVRVLFFSLTLFLSYAHSLASP